MGLMSNYYIAIRKTAIVYNFIGMRTEIVTYYKGGDIRGRGGSSPSIIRIYAKNGIAYLQLSIIKPQPKKHMQSLTSSLPPSYLQELMPTAIHCTPR